MNPSGAVVSGFAPDGVLRAGLRFGTSFIVIRQATGVRVAAATYLATFIEEMKHSGFVARALLDSGVCDVSVAPPA